MWKRPGPLAALVAVMAAACALDFVAGPIPAGTWGGKQGNLAVYADSATLDLPCAAGRIPQPLTADSAGRFDLQGFWAPTAGPVSINGPLWEPARFTGLRTDNHIEMTVTVHPPAGNDPLHAPSVTDFVVGPLVFERGVVGQFPRCY